MLLQLSLWIALLLLVGLPKYSHAEKFQQEEEDSYNDALRLACAQALNFLGQQHPDVESAASPFLLGSRIVTLAQSPNGTTVTKTSYPDSNSAIYLHYQQACKDATGMFVPFTGVLDCVRNQNEQRITSTSIYLHMATCFPSDPVCQQYTTEGVAAAQWMVDTERVFGNVCTLREGTLKNVQNVLPPSTTPMPLGEPNFLPVSETNPNYNDEPRKKCLKAFSDTLNLDNDNKEEDPLTKTRLAHFQTRTIETLQEEPILTQREWYTDQHLDTYKQLCQEAQWKFDAFDGTLDCLDIQTNAIQTTLVMESAAICFPPDCQDHYSSFGQWKLDNMLGAVHQSCTIRTPVLEAPKHAASNRDYIESKLHMLTVVLVGLSTGIICAVMLAIGAARWTRKRKRNHIQYDAAKERFSDPSSHTQEESFSPSLQEVELPEVA